MRNKYNVFKIWPVFTVFYLWLYYGINKFNAAIKKLF